MSTIELASLQARHDFDASRSQVKGVLTKALNDDFERLRFFARYASWNGFFGAGVSSLSGRIGRSRGKFMDPAEPLLPAADRSVLVASYFFDAARDEFDDRATAHRDTHRCLSQATLLGIHQLTLADNPDPKLSHPMHLSPRLVEPDWLHALNERVAFGYGKGHPDQAEDLFRAMGYHLGSEVLADEEFTLIDSQMHKQCPGLTEGLEKLKVEVAGVSHGAYQWIAVHSGHGGAAEADHFDWAVEGVRLALSFTPVKWRDAMVQSALSGFEQFAADHDRFFTRVLED